MKKKEIMKTHSVSPVNDTGITAKAIHLIRFKPKTFRVYSEDLISLGTFNSLKKAISTIRRIKKYQRTIIVVHDLDGDVVDIIKPKEFGIDTSERTTIKKRARPSRVSALAI